MDINAFSLTRVPNLKFDEFVPNANCAKSKVNSCKCNIYIYIYILCANEFLLKVIELRARSCATRGVTNRWLIYT